MNTQHLPSFLRSLPLLLVWLSFLLPPAMGWGAGSDGLEPVRAEMRAQRYDKAIALARKVIDAKDPAADEAEYLTALALFHGKKHAEAVQAAERVAKVYPDSVWRYKAGFLKAQALVEQKQFQQAAALYGTEAARLLGAERKQELVGVIVGFADKLTSKPDPNVPDAPKPDYQKAAKLYTKALGMELARSFRDDLLFKKARAIQQAGNYAQAVQDYQAYLTEFDPSWTGPAGSGTPRLPLQNPPPAGRHVAMARFRLAEAQIQGNQLASGRMELEDLLKRISGPAEARAALEAELETSEGKALPSEIRWLMVQSYLAPAPDPAAVSPVQSANRNFGIAPAGGATIGDTGGLPTTDGVLFVLRDGELEASVRACREFLAAAPEGSRAVRAAWMIAEAWQTAHRAEEAIRAYREFIAGQGFSLPAGEAALQFDEEIRANPATHLANLKMRALFRIGVILSQQKKLEEAIAVWRDYVKEYPNGPQWSESQNAMITAEYQMGMDALAARDEAQALERFDQFLRAHPLDSRSPRILFVFGAVHEARGNTLESGSPPGDRPSIDEAYRRAIEEWSKLASKYPQSPEARQALLRSASLHEEKLGECEKALHIYRKLVADFGYADANRSVTRLTAKSLELSVDRTFRTTEKAVVSLKVRNIEKCSIRLHRIDLQAYFRKVHAITGVEGLDVALIQPDKTWEFKPEGYTKYRLFEQAVEIPFPGSEPGAYVVTAGDDELESTVLVLRSDLEVIVKSSRREVLAFVQNMVAGKPAGGVEILVSDGKSLAASGRTGPDGVYKTAIESLKDLANVRLFALGEGHAASFNLDLSGLQISSGLTAKGYLYTDRPAYQPGETVSLRGILREVRDRLYAVPDNAEFKLSITDAQGRLLTEQTVRLSRFGTFDSTFALPAAATTGQYTIAARQERKGAEPLHFQGTFEVRAFTLEKVRLTLDFPRRVWFRGEKIEATLEAGFYWGEPLANRRVRCTLPDGRTEAVTTDEQGRGRLVFDTSGMRPGTVLEFKAALEGENVAAVGTVTLARLGFRIVSRPSQPVVLAGEPFDLRLTTTGADGKPAGEDLKVAVLRIQQPKTSPVMALLPWPEGPVPPAAEVRESELELKTDAATGQAVLPLKLEQGGIYRLRTTGTDRFGQTISHETEVVVSDDTDAVKLRLFDDSATLKVGQSAKVRLHSRLARGLALVTFEGEVILGHRILDLQKGDNALAIDVGHELFPNFRLAVAAMDGRELRTTHKDYTVERELKVTLKPMKEAFLPGETARVAITVTDQTGKPAEAELSLALVNEALFAIHPDLLTPILDFFQKDARRHAEFKIGATCAFQYQGRTRPVARELVTEASRLTRSLAEVELLREARQEMALNMPSPAAPATSGGRARGVGGVGGAFFKLGTLDAESADGLARINEQLALADEPVTGLPISRAKEPAAPRREVRGEGRWLPAIVTDAEGRAEVIVPMPESTTAWRLTARGCTVETLVGQATAQTLTRKDFFVDLKAPSFLREGDEIRIVSRVHNLTAYSGPVALQLRLVDGMDPDREIARREAILQIGAHAGGEAVFGAVTVPALVQVRAEVTALGGSHADSLALDVPVMPWGLAYAAQDGGVAEADAMAVVGLPTNRPYSSLWMSVAVGPDVCRSVVEMALRRGWAGPAGALARLGPPGWGDTPASDLLALATALRYAQGRKLDETQLRELSDRGRALVAVLVSSQAADGTWKSDSLGHLTTARVFWALVEARQSGMVVHKETLEKAAAALLKQFEACDAGDNDGKAVLLHALSTDKRADFANCNRLYRERNALGNSALACLSRAFFNLERREIAAELASLLQARIKIEPGQRAVWPSDCKPTWLNDADETTAMVLLALAETLPDAEATRAAAQSLLQSRGCFAFPTPRAHGPAVAALSIWLGRGQQQSVDLEITIAVNGRDIGTVKSAAGLGQHLFPVPRDAVRAEKNTVEFKMRGRGRFAYAATLNGFSPDVTPSPGPVRPCMDRVELLHAPLEYRGRSIGAASSSPVKHLENGQRVKIMVRNTRGAYADYTHRYALEIPLPPGARLDESTLSMETSRVRGREVTDSGITLFFDGWQPWVGFELTGYVPGKFRLPPPVIRELGNPGFMAVGPVAELTVLAAGEKSPDPYEMNDGERFALGRCYFEDGDLATALEYLAELRKRDPRHAESEQARMLLWIHTTPRFYDSRKIVDLFEVLRERYPQLEIPFDRILVVGKAYADIGEFERSWLVYRAAITASFNNDSGISAVLEDEGRFLGSIDFLERLWREHPDTAEVVSSYFALSQLLFQKAPKAHELPKEDSIQPEKVAMLKRAASMLFSFMAMHPKDPLADDAAFSLVNGMLALKNYPMVVALGGEFSLAYADSPLAPGLQYVTALGLFWQNRHAEALAAARLVADGDSKDRDFARYILGQIYHAQTKPREAIEWYGRVKQLYPDAAEAIAYFEKKSISLDEVTVFKPGQAVELNLKFRNIREAFIQVYRVDLMKLYLQQKNLSAITSVQLAGIRPELDQSIRLGDGLDYLDKERKISLPLREEAAYLVIGRGDDLFASGMVLITPLKIEVQEEAASGRVRANVLDSVNAGCRPEVHVKAIGSADTEFRSGETDLRGLFIADNIRGKATVIAREGESRYAFFRGQTWLGAPINAPAPQPAQGERLLRSVDYQYNLDALNGQIQLDNRGRFDSQRRQAPAKGVQTKQAF